MKIRAHREERILVNDEGRKLATTPLQPIWIIRFAGNLKKKFYL